MSVLGDMGVNRGMTEAGTKEVEEVHQDLILFVILILCLASGATGIPLFFLLDMFFRCGGFVMILLQNPNQYTYCSFTLGSQLVCRTMNMHTITKGIYHI